MKITWKQDFPDEVEIVYATYSLGWFYDLRRSGKRWFVVRTAVLNGYSERTKFYPNLSKVGEVYDELTERE